MVRTDAGNNRRSSICAATIAARLWSIVTIYSMPCAVALGSLA